MSAYITQRLGTFPSGRSAVSLPKYATELPIGVDARLPEVLNDGTVGGIVDCACHEHERIKAILRTQPREECGLISVDDTECHGIAGERIDAFAEAVGEKIFKQVSVSIIQVAHFKCPGGKCRGSRHGQIDLEFHLRPPAIELAGHCCRKARTWIFTTLSSLVGLAHRFLCFPRAMGVVILAAKERQSHAMQINFPVARQLAFA
jgi:hypothetical protein